MISITIPTYEMNGTGCSFLEQSFRFLEKQTFKEFQIVISDHSYNNDIMNLCLKFKNLNIKYIKNEKNRGNSSANLNNAIYNSDFDIIKILMQDEYIFKEDTLSQINESFFCKNTNWVATGFFNGNINSKMIPYYDDHKVIHGHNPIGSPSIISIRKTKDLEIFNEDLIWLMDCEYYKRLFDKWGHPKIINDYKIFINHHQNQLTNIIKDEIKQKEHFLLKKKYDKN